MFSSIRNAFAMMEPGFFRKFCATALPISTQLILASSLALVDVLMVSSLGASSVAAVGLAGKFFFVIILMISGLANGASVLAAQYVGKHDDAGIKRVLSIALAVAWCAALPFSLATWFCPEFIMRLYSSDPEVIKIGAQFLHLTAPFHIIMATISVLSAVLRATGKATLPMLVGFLAIACNTGLNYLLIFGNFGAPKMGVDGAAIATLISKIVECSVMLAVIYLSSSRIAISVREFVQSFDLTELRLFLRQSLPLVINEGVWAMGIFAFTIVYGHMGTNELASISMLGPIEGISLEIFIGFTSAASIFISTALGARQFAQAQRLAWVSACLITAGSIVYGLLLIALRPQILSLYSSADPQVLAIANDVFLVIALTLWLRLYNCVTCVSILRSGGDVKFTLYVDLVVIWLIVLPMTAYAGLVLKWPVQWVFAVALGGEALIKAPIYTIRIASLVWLKSLVSKDDDSEMPAISQAA